jgi:hypothetical protein
LKGSASTDPLNSVLIASVSGDEYEAGWLMMREGGMGEGALLALIRLMQADMKGADERKEKRKEARKERRRKYS